MTNLLRTISLILFISLQYAFNAFTQQIICEEQVNISLDENGEAFVSADIFLEGVWDPADTLVHIVVPAQASHGNTPPPGTPSHWLFTCDDLGPTTADIWVDNYNGSWSWCTVDIIIEDKLDPTIECPDDITIDCTVDHRDTKITGEMIATKICGEPVNVFYQDYFTELDCQTSVVDRSWFYTNHHEQDIKACKQKIVIENVSIGDIVWPEDISIYKCDVDPKELDPKFLNSLPNVDIESCGYYETKFDDKVSKICSQQVLIERTWTAVNWCTGESIHHVQEIKLICETSEPIALCINGLIAAIGPDGTVILYAQDLDIGSYDECGSELSFTASVDGKNFYEKLEFTCDDLGKVKVVLQVENAEGETDYCETQIEIADPSGVCKDGKKRNSGLENTEVNVYPNPASSFINIDMHVYNKSTAYVNIKDMSGKLLKTYSNLNLGSQNIIVQTIASLHNSQLIILELFDGNKVYYKKVQLLK